MPFRTLKLPRRPGPKRSRPARPAGCWRPSAARSNARTGERMKEGAALPERRLQAPLLVIPGGLLAEFLRIYGKVSHGIGARFMEVPCSIRTRRSEEHTS